MSAENLEQQLRTLLSEASRKDMSGAGLDDDLVAVLGLDSLTSLRLLATVEKRLGVRFPDEQLSNLRTLRRLLAFISSAPGEHQP